MRERAAEASAKVEAEPVGYLFRLRYGTDNWSQQLMFSETLPSDPADVKEVTPLYASPPASAGVRLEELIRPMEGYDRQQDGYHHRQGWNDAIRRVMDLQRAAHPSPAPVSGEDLRRAEAELARSRNAMDASTFHGRKRTDEALARVKDIRRALATSPADLPVPPAADDEILHRVKSAVAEVDALPEALGGKAPAIGESVTEAMPATGPFVDRIIRIFRDRPDDDGTAVVLQEYARAALTAALAAKPGWRARIAGLTFEAAGKPVKWPEIRHAFLMTADGRTLNNNGQWLHPAAPAGGTLA